MRHRNDARCSHDREERREVDSITIFKSRKFTIITCIYPIVIHTVIEGVSGIGAAGVSVASVGSSGGGCGWNGSEEVWCRVNSLRWILVHSGNRHTCRCRWNQTTRHEGVQSRDGTWGRQIPVMGLVIIQMVVACRRSRCKCAKGGKD